MNFNEFVVELSEKCNKINIDLNEFQMKQFYDYMNILLDWNKLFNLTAITDEKEIILKHFIDCLVINKFVNDNCKVADIGTGAGFPGVPIKIANPNIKITLVDSLNKRINFLKELVINIKLDDVEIFHARAEELSRDSNFRECFDVVVSRAVAPLNVLVEYTLPFLKCGGFLIAMKGSNAQEEINLANNAIDVLGGKFKLMDEVVLPDSNIKRNVIIIEKVKGTPKQFPRKAGKPSKSPLV